MKTFPLLLALCLTTLFSYGQYCGNSGSSICTSSGTLTQSGFTPNEDVPCIYRNQSTNTVVEFYNFSNFMFGGQSVTVNTLRFDSIEELPNGLCWATDQVDNTFSTLQHGCIKFSGATTAPAGQYKPRIIVTADIGVPIQTDADAAGLKYYLKVIDNTFPVCPPLDTNQTAAYAPFNGSYQNGAYISGRVYYDQNQNNIYDAGDVGAANQMVNIGNDYIGLTNSAGYYYTFALNGSYVIAPAPASQVAAFTVNPPNITTSAVVVGNAYPYNDFAVVVPANVCLGNLSVIANNPPPRPGFSNDIVVKFKNELSGSPVSQTIRMFYPAQQSFISAAPTPSLVDTVAKLLEWQTGNLNIGGQWQANIAFQTPPPPAVALGTVLQYSASVVNSSCSSLDTLQTRQFVTVVGSFDPNDKAVSPVGYSDNHAVNPNTVFSYTVRFQNTGNYLAEDVVIVDTISQHLNLSTLKVKAASHNYEVNIDNSNRTVKFIFDQIMLPDSFSNEPGSHGYIQYSIQPNSNYTNGSIVTNRADIYFDFNPPILTNVVYNTLDDNISSVTSLMNETRFSVFPNPFTERLEIRIEKAEAADRLEIFDVTGRKVLSEKVLSPQFAVSTAALQAGVYLVKLGSAVKRVVKE